MPGRGTGGVVCYAFAVTRSGQRSGTCTVEDRVYRYCRPQNATASDSERTVRVEIEISRPWGDRVVYADCDFDLPHPFVVLV